MQNWMQHRCNLDVLYMQFRYSLNCVKILFRLWVSGLASAKAEKKVEAELGNISDYSFILCLPLLQTSVNIDKILDNHPLHHLPSMLPFFSTIPGQVFQYSIWSSHPSGTWDWYRTNPPLLQLGIFYQVFQHISDKKLGLKKQIFLVFKNEDFLKRRMGLV